MILVDTNVFIEILAGGPAGRGAVRTLESADPGEKFAYSVLTGFELCVRPEQREAARRLLTGFEAIAVTPAIAWAAAKLFHEHLSGNRRHIPDSFIAATALASGAALWTLDRSEFKRIPGLRLFSP